MNQKQLNEQVEIDESRCGSCIFDQRDRFHMYGGYFNGYIRELISADIILK